MAPLFQAEAFSDKVIAPAVCKAVSSPILAALVLAWVPLIIYSVLSGFLVTGVQLENT